MHKYKRKDWIRDNRPDYRLSLRYDRSKIRRLRTVNGNSASIKLFSRIQTQLTYSTSVWKLNISPLKIIQVQI